MQYAALKFIIILSLGAVLASCATMQNASFGPACTQAGFPDGHPQRSECIKNTAAASQRQTLGDLGINAGGSSPEASHGAGAASDVDDAALGYSIGCAIAGGCSRPAVVGNHVSSQRRLCPNGQYVYGDACYRAPDGTYVGAVPYRAPDGSYVGGPGQMILCPDRRYVVGSQCILNPDGSYRGQ